MPDASLLVGLWSGQQETRTVYNSQGQVTATNTMVLPVPGLYAHYLRFTPTTVMDSSVNLVIASGPVAMHPYPYTVQGNTFTTPVYPPGTTIYTTTYTIKALTAHALHLLSSTSAGNTLERTELEVSYVK